MKWDNGESSALTMSSSLLAQPSFGFNNFPWLYPDNIDPQRYRSQLRTPTHLHLHCMGISIVQTNMATLGSLHFRLLM